MKDRNLALWHMTQVEGAPRKMVWRKLRACDVSAEDHLAEGEERGLGRTSGGWRANWGPDCVVWRVLCDDFILRGLGSHETLWQERRGIWMNLKWRQLLLLLSIKAEERDQWEDRSWGRPGGRFGIDLEWSQWRWREIMDMWYVSNSIGKTHTEGLNVNSRGRGFRQSIFLPCKGERQTSLFSGVWTTWH